MATVVIERTFAHAPEKLWRALTESSLLAQWLMQNDFTPQPGHHFKFNREPVPGWDGVIDCKVLIVEPQKRLSYTWTAMGLETVVLFTMAAVEGGTQLRMEQSGFASETDMAFKGATYGWQKFLITLESLLKGDTL